MGLDMYLSAHKSFKPISTQLIEDISDGDKPTDIPAEESTSFEIGYWRKHPNLHGYIVDTFAGGKGDCQEIELDKKALEKIVCAVKERKLPTTEGFFFGKSSCDDEEIAQDLKILGEALSWLEEKEDGSKKSVAYRASW